MIKTMPRLREKLKDAGYIIEDIRFYGPGRKLICIGFRVSNVKNGNRIEVEAQDKMVWKVDYYKHNGTIPENRCTHYARLREGFLPGMCRHVSKMQKEMFEHLKT